MDACPKCRKNGMRRWSKDPKSAENARACQECGHVEEKPKK